MRPQASWRDGEEFSALNFFVATGQAILEKEFTALEALYSRIMPTAEAMGGRATRVASQIGIPSAMVATEQSEMVPALLLDMPDDYEVKFTPCNPMGIGYALLVRVRRMQGGVPKDSMTFTSGGTVGKGPTVRCWTMSCANG